MALWWKLWNLQASQLLPQIPSTCSGANSRSTAAGWAPSSCSAGDTMAGGQSWRGDSSRKVEAAPHQQSWDTVLTHAYKYLKGRVWKDGARLFPVVPRARRSGIGQNRSTGGSPGPQEAPMCCLPQHAVVHQSNAFLGLLVLNTIENHFQNLGFFFSSSKNKLQLFNQYLFHHSTGVEEKKKET